MFKGLFGGTLLLFALFGNRLNCNRLLGCNACCSTNAANTCGNPFANLGVAAHGFVGVSDPPDNFLLTYHCHHLQAAVDDVGHLLLAVDPNALLLTV